MKYRTVALVVILTASFGSMGAEAATSKDRLRQQAEAMCAGDAAQLCGDVMGDDAQTAECMKANQAQLSPACRKASKALNAK